MIFTRQTNLEYSVGEKYFEMVREGLLTVAEIEVVDNFGEALMGSFVWGYSVTFEQNRKSNSIKYTRWERRGVEDLPRSRD